MGAHWNHLGSFTKKIATHTGSNLLWGVELALGFYFFKETPVALAGVAQWIEHGVPTEGLLV